MRVLREYNQPDRHSRLPNASRSVPEPVSRFRELVRNVARCANEFPHQLLFFRGQPTDHKNQMRNTTLYPSIYRGPRIRREEVMARYETLEAASTEIVNRLSVAPELKHNRTDLRRRKYIQWSILQHYDVCPTPLLDVSQSLRVACSFALRNNDTHEGYVYVLALPYVTNRISMNSEEDIVNVRLLSICPSEALRPHFQEGYVVGTLDITTEYEKKSELDFNRRLVRKYSIPNDQEFWGQDSGPVADALLFPNDDDRVLRLCNDIKGFSNRMARPGEIGDFVLLWSRLEVSLRNTTDISHDRGVSIGRAIEYLLSTKRIDKRTSVELENLRTLRNRVVHRTHEVDAAKLRNQLDVLRRIITRLDISNVD